MANEMTNELIRASAAGRKSSLLLLFRELRLHQWAKNTLLLVPLATSHQIGDRSHWAPVLLAFLSFGMVASSVYVLNDLRDLETDRQHPRKRMRPFASGALPTLAGMVAVPILLLGGGLLALPLPRQFWMVLGGYWLATLTYSLGLKRYAILDVAILAGLYTARVFAGGAAIGVQVSEWLAAFAMFLFFSLAFLKRSSELVTLRTAPAGRGYRAEDRELVFMMGITSGYLSVLVLALYISSQDVLKLYRHPSWLWFLCPLLLYWISHLWLRSRRGEVDDDPVIYAMKEPTSWGVLALGALVTWLGV